MIKVYGNKVEWYNEFKRFIERRILMNVFDKVRTSTAFEKKLEKSAYCCNWKYSEVISANYQDNMEMLSGVETKFLIERYNNLEKADRII